MAINVFPNVSRPQSSLQMVSDYTSLLIDFVGAEVSVITGANRCSCLRLCLQQVSPRSRADRAQFKQEILWKEKGATALHSKQEADPACREIEDPNLPRIRGDAGN